jgi:hypothetical protein
MCWRLVLALVLIAARAWAVEPSCQSVIGEAEARLGVPRGLLQAIALAESGRTDPESGRLMPWPWTIASGTGFSRYEPDKAAAIATVERLQADGRRNIDVGCMQVNLKHHPDAFPSLEAAFDPVRNVEYGGRFLVALQRETGSWERAVERYHSADPMLGPGYRQVVLARWEQVRSGRTLQASAGHRMPTVLRPAPAGAARAGLFAWLAPARGSMPPPGQSLWSHGPARPLLLRGPPSQQDEGGEG